MDGRERRAKPWELAGQSLWGRLAHQDARRQELTLSCPADNDHCFLALGFSGNPVSSLLHSDLLPMKPPGVCMMGAWWCTQLKPAASTVHERFLSAPVSPSCQPPTVAVRYPWLPLGWPRRPEIVYPKAWPHQLPTIARCWGSAQQAVFPGSAPLV